MYYKIVATYKNKEDYMLDELRNGRLRYGWSWKDCDLSIISSLSADSRTDGQKLSWRMTQFLLWRVKKGDILIVQLKQPLREFYIVRVTGTYYFDDKPKEDFNHILPIELISEKAIKISSSIIPNHVRHDLSKRGNYYSIYPRNTVEVLEKIISKKSWNSPEAEKVRTYTNEIAETNEIITKNVIDTIRNQWKAKDFETFIAKLFDNIDNIKTIEAKDRGKGWDLLIQVMDPLTDEVLHDNVPVQCKNFTSKVSTIRPISDLERCIDHNESNSNVVYLAILGELDDAYRKLIEELSIRKGCIIRIVEEERIAELYMKHYLKMDCE